MPQTRNATAKDTGDRWGGWVEENPGVDGLTPTRNALPATSRATLAEAPGSHRAETRSAAGAAFEFEKVSIAA